jgi:hypothetical protein
LETFVLCRSRDRREKEKAMHDRFQQRIEEGLKRIDAACRRQRLKAVTVAQRIGRLLGENTRAAGLFQVEVKEANGRASLAWHKVETWRDWASLSEGRYLLRSILVRPFERRGTLFFGYRGAGLPAPVRPGGTPSAGAGVLGQGVLRFRNCEALVASGTSPAGAIPKPRPTGLVGTWGGNILGGPPGGL